MALEGQSYGFELKYATRGLNIRLTDEQFNLLDKAAQDIIRHDFLKDVVRLETIIGLNRAAGGYAVLLTNDSSYWKNPNRLNTVDAAFRVHEGRESRGMLAWDSRAGQGTIFKRDEPLSLIFQYVSKWRDYSQFAGSYGRFRYLAFEVRNAS